MEIKYEDLIAFHGHSCPGLAIGYRMTEASLRYLSQQRAEDEELVAIVENNACGVDALQFITGCTFGKGNLIFRDYGKHVFTLYSRKSKKGVRVAFDPIKTPENISQDRDALVNWLLNVDEKEIISLEDVNITEPEPAQIRASVKCDFCEESMMESRAEKIGDKLACMPCAKRLRGEKTSRQT
ncbi:MAG: FmdE family protein [Thermodesulfobacteriota bacterium]|nr:FmdE family protein [Thermodesulfobacteriota bacterium]